MFSVLTVAMTNYPARLMCMHIYISFYVPMLSQSCGHESIEKAFMIVVRTDILLIVTSDDTNGFLYLMVQ